MRALKGETCNLCVSILIPHKHPLGPLPALPAFMEHSQIHDLKDDQLYNKTNWTINQTSMDECR